LKGQEEEEILHLNPQPQVLLQLQQPQRGVRHLALRFLKEEGKPIQAKQGVLQEQQLLDSRSPLTQHMLHN
jgi:hypothetical protein